MTQYHNFVGIDIGKDSFFVAFHGETLTTTYPNTDGGRQKFYEDHADRLKTALVVLETTGGYEYDLLSYLTGQQVVVHRAHAQKIKNFIRSFGRLAKTDKIDALAIAHYASDRHKLLTPYEPFEFLQTELRSLVERRIDLVQMLAQEKNRAKAPGNKSLKPYIE